MDEKLTHMLSIQKSPTDKTGLRIKGRTKLMEMFWALRSPLPSKNLPYGITVDWVGMSDPNAPFLKLRKQRSRKKCPKKQITAQDLWPSIRLHGIRLFIRLHGIKLQNLRPLIIKSHGIKTQGIMPHDARLLSISGLCRDLFLPIIVANPRPTNPDTSKSRRRWWMINTTGSHLFGCRTWCNGLISTWNLANNHP
jgi:hypothetical protein